MRHDTIMVRNVSPGMSALFNQPMMTMMMTTIIMTTTTLTIGSKPDSLFPTELPELELDSRDTFFTFLTFILHSYDYFTLDDSL